MTIHNSRSWYIALICFIFVFYNDNVESKIADYQKKQINHLLQNEPKETQKTVENGKSLYMKYCLSCHQQDGSGVPNTFPPLQNSNWINGDKNKLIKVLLNGLEGEIDVNDEVYSGTMPKQNYLTDRQIAELLTFIRQNFDNKADTVKPDDVKNIREK